MTTIETLTLSQVQTLSTEAAQVGDLEMVRDCETVEAAYLASDESELSAMIDVERGEVRAAASRIVDAISDAEARAAGTDNVSGNQLGNLY